MQFIVHNSKIIPANEFALSSANRSFMYGDSVFETMVFKHGKIRFLEDHLERLFQGLKALSISKEFYQSEITEAVSALLKEENLENARLKLQAYRKEGGLVQPMQNDAEWILSAAPLIIPSFLKNKCGVYNEIPNRFSKISRFKTGNFLPYVLASIEKKELGLDEMIILDVENNISECTTSNIFWLKGHTLYTPSIETGCIEGIMRKQIFRWSRENNIQILEGKFKIEELNNADVVFTCNVSGICAIHEITNNAYKNTNPGINRTFKQLASEFNL
ncbi:MAG: aminotransferase class IV [Cytophagaceae bacterium]